MNNTIIAWTRQAPEVWDELQNTGTYYVREAYIRSKNGPISDYYLELYRWYTLRCRSYLAIPEGLSYPIWLALTEEARLPPAENTFSLTLEVPSECLFIMDYDKWGYRVNHWYIPVDAEDERRYNEELKRCGIDNEALLIMTDKGNYYPMLRQKIIRSWDRLFAGPSANPDANVGTVRERKADWVREVEIYGA